ncbi:transcription factor [Scheffersomyces xylosifermentans]|uniref:transcription factor n=1 Tax=Scheffersomyces xylosifermentans TaxID=1304137 RepID=UPI00315C9AB8
MESPLNIGDLTTSSIQHRLNDTHLSTSSVAQVSSAIYSGHKVIQLTLNLQVGPSKFDSKLVVLRRVQDSYVNVTQLFSILLRLNHFTESQLENYLSNEILSNIQFSGAGSGPGKNNHYIDLRKHENYTLRGLWIPYDKAVSLALKFDIYEFTKSLFLVDVHDFDKLPKTNKRFYDGDEEEDASLMGSPTKKQKTGSVSTTRDETDSKSSLQNGDSVNDKNNHIKPATHNDLVDRLAAKNTNYPYTLNPIGDSDTELANELKTKLSEVFRRDDESKSAITLPELKSLFQPILSKHSPSVYMDFALDTKGQTALHFASTLSSINLVAGFIELGLNSPVRGNQDGESPLISAIQVTNSMEKGNFKQLLEKWLYPDLWLYDNKKWTFLHHLASQSAKKVESSKFYCEKIIEYVVTDSKLLNEVRTKLVNTRDEENGNTALHLAAENESTWFVKILLELGADVSLSNKRGVKPIDFDIVKDLSKPDSKDQFDDYIFELIRTSVEFLEKRLDINGEIATIENPKSITPPSSNLTDDIDNGINSSNKIFSSIQHLLANTNVEYEAILNAKREQIISLNKSLHDATIVTANNRFLTKKVTEKLIELDNLKLQTANISDKLQLSKQEMASIKGGEELETDSREFDADEPFVIKPLYEKLANGESVDDLRNNEELLKSLQPIPILKARINAYKQINAKIENELNTLLDYSELASKFKKVVSICTGVGINEVDELLDGLLQAVEGQQ